MSYYSSEDYYDSTIDEPPYRPHRYFIDVDGERRQVVITEKPPHYMPDALGVTDGVYRVVVQEGLPYKAWKELLYHEFRHVKNRARDGLLNRDEREHIVRRECQVAGRDRYLMPYAA